MTDKKENSIVKKVRYILISIIFLGLVGVIIGGIYTGRIELIIGPGIALFLFSVFFVSSETGIPM